MSIKVSVGGKFRMVAIKPDGSERVLADWFDNLILNNGLDRLAQNQPCVSYARVGSGSSAPSVADTNLQTPVASTSTAVGAVVSGNADTAPYFGWKRKTMRFAAGAAAGTLSEVGVGWGTSSGQLFSRALIKNSSGDPITLTVLSDEILDVTYELQLYAPSSDVPFNITIADVEYACVARASRVTSADWQPGGFGSAIIPQVFAHSGTIGTVTQSPNGTSAGGSVVEATYVNGSFAEDAVTTFGLNVANFGAGGINSLSTRTSNFGAFQFSFSPFIPKDANKVLTLNTTFTLARHTPD